MGRELPPEINAGESSSRTEEESVEELEKRLEQYPPLWQTPFEYQETLQALGGDGNEERRTINMECAYMGEDEAKQLGEAVASNKSLEVLMIKLDSIYDEEEKLPTPTSTWPMDSFLTAAFLGPERSRNTSVLSLIIASSSTDGDTMRLGVLPQVIRENKSIRSFAIRWHGDDGTSKEELLDLLEALKVNSTIESLTLPNLVSWDFPDRADLGFLDVETFSQIVSIAERKTIFKLELHVGECRGGATDFNLDAFYRALKANSTLRFLRLRGPFYTQIAADEFSNWLRTTSGLRELQLESCGDDESDVMKAVFRALRENKSLRKLKLEDYVTDEDDDLEELINALKENSSIQDIVFDPKSDWEAVVTEALQNGRPQ